MPIKLQCEHCQTTLNVNDKMAGKRGKCPKCSKPIVIPGNDDDLQLQADPSNRGLAASSGPSSGWGTNAKSPLDDLLDEAGVQAATTGPTCPNCAADLDPSAVLCIECGFDMTAGRQVRTQVGYDHEADTTGMSENEKMMLKAEREVAERPISVEEGDHGDGADSFLIAIGMLIVFTVVVALGIGVIFLMDKFTTDSAVSMQISFGMCIILYWIGHLWLMIVAFREGVGHGLAIMFASQLYEWFYGFTRFRGLWIPTMLTVIGTLGSIGSYLALLYMF